MSGTKARRRELNFATLQEAIADVELLRSGYTPTASWNLEQNLSHINKAMLMGFEPVDFGLPRLVRPIMRWLFLGRMSRLGSRAIPFRAAAPPEMQPSDSEDLDNVVSQFSDLVERTESPDATFLPEHPIFGRLDTDGWRTMQRWHAAHHLSHLVPTSA